MSAHAISGEWWNPPGFDDVDITFYVAPDAVHYTAVGLPHDLVAVGAVEPEMVVPGRPGQQRRDSFGDRYWRQKKNKYGPRAERLTIMRYIKSLERARQLPGIPPDLDHELIDWLHRHPGHVHAGPAWYAESERLHSGTRSALVDAGLAKDEYFVGRFDAQGSRVVVADRVIIYTLIDQFYGLVFLDGPPQPRRSSCLRLVWSRSDEA